MDSLPRWKLLLVDNLPCWCIDWREQFREGTRRHSLRDGGEMRGFHVVFLLRVHRSGTLIFWDDDGCIIRRGQHLLHMDRSAHGLSRHEIAVREGDLLEIAHWQLGWDWIWCARLADEPETLEQTFLPYLDEVRELLHSPGGPALKMYTHGAHPLRAVAGIYSMILNGYTPAGVYLYGEEQWSRTSREIFARLLPFANVISQRELLERVRAYGGVSLAQLTRQHWFVAKSLIGLGVPPFESCVLDDDVFILDRVDDALAALARCDLVYSPDQDLGEGYIQTWGRLLHHPRPLPTARFNAGLYWIRNLPPARLVAPAALRCRPLPHLPFLWEQGLIALSYAERATCELPVQRYLFPLFDGLPAGLLGYDYRNNPCGFAAIHFGGLAEKPSDAISVQLLSEILQRRRNVRKSEATVA